MTIKELFDKVETTNEILRVVEKRFNVMITFEEYACREFETYDEFIFYMNINFAEWYIDAFLNTTFNWCKPINKVLFYTPQNNNYSQFEITLCENDIL